MPRSVLLLMPSVAAILLVACFGGDDTPSTTLTSSPPAATATRQRPTATPAPPTPSPSPSPVALPEPPERLADYALVIARFLTEVGAPVGCPDDLLDAWQIPISPPQRCAQADTDGDGSIELVLVLTTPELPSPDLAVLDRPVMIAVLDHSAGQWNVTYRTPDAVEEGGFLTSTVEGGPEVVLLAVRDLNGLPGAEVAYRVDSCGAHTCYTTVEIVGWDGTNFADLTPEEVTTSYANVALEDRDGDDIVEIVLHGGSIGSVGAGPTRTGTEVYRWNGAAWTLAETVNDPATMLYHVILDADETFAAGDYASAIEIYKSALADASLGEWKEDERSELEPYALFRIALGRIAQGGDPADMDSPLRQAIERSPDSLHGRLARAFREAWLADGDASAGCRAALAFVQGNFEAFEDFWYFGYANPPFDAQALCPF